MKSLLAALAFLVIILVGISFIPQPDLPDMPQQPNEQQEPALIPFASPLFGIAFSYPEGYFTTVTDHEGERLQSTITIFEDTPFTRALVNGEVPGTEAPPAISVAMFQNDLDNYTAESFVRDNSASNFKLSDGVLTPVSVGGVEGFAYRATGLYESENVVVATPDFVYMFSVGFLTPEDRMLADFETMLANVSFDAVRVPTSADGAPPGSIHNLPVPAAVSAVRVAAAERADVSPESVIVMSAIEREWPDSCLGLGAPDVMCAQVITPGYAVTVQAGDELYSYRVSSDGGFIIPELP